MKILNFDSTIATVSAGTAAAPSISFANDPNTGIYSPGADQVAISTGGTQRFLVDASGNITIAGALTAGSLSGPSSFSLGSAASPSVYFGTDTNTGLYSPGADQVAISTGGTGRLFITAAGRVGIGTASPATALHVQSSGALATFVGNSANEYIQVSDNNGSTSATFGAIGGGDCYIFSGSGKSTRIYAGAQERARIDSSGRLLVGTVSARSNFFNTTASAGLQVEGTSASTAHISITGNATNDTPQISINRSRGAAIGSNTIVQDGDIVGGINFQGNDGSEFVQLAVIAGAVDGTPGVNDMPGRLLFLTTPDGAASPQEQLRITSDRYVRLASGTGGIQFNGDTAAANALDDYEEGTFTPTITSGITTPTYSANTRGTYRKIGSFVYFTLRVQLTAGTTSAAGLVVGGLPFAIAANIEFRVVFHGSFLSGAGAASVTANGLNSTTYMDILNAGSGAVISGTTATNTMDIQITGAYPTTV